MNEQGPSTPDSVPPSPVSRRNFLRDGISALSGAAAMGVLVALGKNPETGVSNEDSEKLRALTEDADQGKYPDILREFTQYLVRVDSQTGIVIVDKSNQRYVLLRNSLYSPKRDVQGAEEELSMRVKMHFRDLDLFLLSADDQNRAETVLPHGLSLARGQSTEERVVKLCYSSFTEADPTPEVGLLRERSFQTAHDLGYGMELLSPLSTYKSGALVDISGNFVGVHSPAHPTAKVLPAVDILTMLNTEAQKQHKNGAPLLEF